MSDTVVDSSVVAKWILPEPATSFVARLHRDLTARGFDVRFDRMAMPSRGLTFHQKTQDAVATRKRLVLAVGPKAAGSDYARREWQFALHPDEAVTPVLRQGDYPLVPDELKLLHCDDFPDDAQHSPSMPFICSTSSGSCASRSRRWAS